MKEKKTGTFLKIHFVHFFSVQFTSFHLNEKIVLYISNTDSRLQIEYWHKFKLRFKTKIKCRMEEKLKNQFAQKQTFRCSISVRMKMLK
jgi:hypothetical protein